MTPNTWRLGRGCGIIEYNGQSLRTRETGSVYSAPRGLAATLGAPVHAKRAGQFLQKNLLPQIFCERSEQKF